MDVCCQRIPAGKRRMKKHSPLPLTIPAFGNPNAPPDSVSYAVYIRDMASASLHSHESDRKGLETYTGILREKKLYELLQDEHGRFFRSWTEFCLAKQPYGLERSADDIAALLTEAKDAKTIAEQAEPLKEHGTNQHTEGSGGNGVTSSVTPRGNSAAYRTARIARDAPAVLERMKAGEFSTVAEAERAAGLKIIEDRRIWLSANPEEAAEQLIKKFSHAYLTALVQTLRVKLTEGGKEAA